jgi:hypothetical protein
MNLSEIGEHFGISRERVRQIEALGWPDDSTAESTAGIKRKISSTNPEVRSKKIDRLCRAWNRASREARLMFLNSAPDFIAESISVDDVETTVSTKTAA